MERLTIYYPEKLSSPIARQYIERGKKFPYRNQYTERLLEVMSGQYPSDVPFSPFHLGQEVKIGHYIAWIDIDSPFSYAYVVSIYDGSWEVYSEEELYRVMGYVWQERKGWIKQTTLKGGQDGKSIA